MLRLLIVIFSMIPPSTSSSANPRHARNVQFSTVTFLNPPFASVPNLIRPFLTRLGFILPSSKVPISKPETWQLTMVRFSVMTLLPNAKLLLGQSPSSYGELIRQFETVVLRQQSISIPSRSVSIVTLSTVRPSQPVARIAKWPPLRIVKSRKIMFRHTLRAIALLPRRTGGWFVRGAFGLFQFLNPLIASCGPSPLTNPSPLIIPGPVIETFVKFSPQIRLLWK